MVIMVASWSVRNKTEVEYPFIRSLMVEVEAILDVAQYRVGTYEQLTDGSTQFVPDDSDKVCYPMPEYNEYYGIEVIELMDIVVEGVPVSFCYCGDFSSGTVYWTVCG